MTDAPPDDPHKLQLDPLGPDISDIQFAPPTVIDCGCKFHASSIDPQVAERAHESHSCYTEPFLPESKTWHESVTGILRPIAVGLAVTLVILAVAFLSEGSGLWTR